ncbi:MAG: hypothetical protein JO036_04760 [Candidatus Eremiobacteraeota bacterium]|nr:hypothetical protein [Candidatus Eremiobacteraeota bacterium]
MVRTRIRRTGVALVIAGMFLSSVDVNPAGEIPGAYADAPLAPASAPASPEASPSAPASAAASPSPAAALAIQQNTPAPVSSDEPKAPEAGDLTHLTFTATDGLSASLIAPADDAVAPSTTTSVEVETVRGAGVEVKVGDVVVPFSRIGKRTVDNKTGSTHYVYYGVVLAPGPNVVSLTPLGAGGARGTTSAHRVYGPGRPTTLALSASGPLRADGASEDELHLEGHDQWGHRAAAGSVVRVTLISGDARLARVKDEPREASATPVPLATSSAAPDPQQPAAIRQTVDVVLGADGTAVVKLIPGLTPGDLVVHAECGESVRDARFFLAPNLRKPFVNGLITAGAGAVPGNPNQPDGDPNGTNSRRGRIAVFGTGVLGKSLATFAYDTADRLQRTPSYGGAYDGDPNDKPYLVTGDASTRRDDALSRDHLFARIDAGRTSAEWGEFRARTSANDSTLGGFDQLVDGAKLELNGQFRRASAFAARNDVGYDRRVIAPSGLANGIALRPDIVVGSELIVLATLDAHTGAVLSQTPLTRGVDYAIEYATGQLRFIDVPLPFDEVFNPRELVITYEFNAPGNSAMTVGGRAETTFGRNHAIKLGAGYVNDSSGAGNVTLASQDLSGTFSGGNWNITHASSQGALLATSAGVPLAGSGGGALHASYNRATGADRLSFLYDRTGIGYYDPFGGLTTPGLLNERLTFTHKLAGSNGELSLDVGHQSNIGLGGGGSNEQTTAALRMRRAFGKRFVLNASVERRVATSNLAGGSAATAQPTPFPLLSPLPNALVPYQAPPTESSTQVSLGADWRAAHNVDVSVNRLQTIAGSNEVQPAQTDAQIAYDLGKSGRAYLRERWSASPVQSFAAATQSLTAGSGGTRSTQFGITRNLGPATTLESSWSIDHTANGDDVYAAMGARERFKLGRTSGDLTFQHANAVGENAANAGFNLYGMSLNYADPSQRFRASASGQFRTGNDAGVSLTLGATGALSPDLSLFALINDARAIGSNESDERAGLAWRPSRSDKGVTLLQYERQDGTSTLNNTQSGVLSLEQVLRVRERTTLVGRYAYKLNGDSQYAASSSLAGFRVDQAVGSRLDADAEVRQSNIRGIAGTKATALGVEGGVRLGDQTRLGVGYNFSATADPSLSTTPAHRGVYVTITSVVNRLFGWGKR